MKRHPLLKRIAGSLLLAAAIPFLTVADTVAPQAELPARASVEEVAKRVADWQLRNIRADYNRKYKGANRLNAWTYGSMYVGMSKWAEQSGEDRYYEFLKSMGEELDWSLLAAKYYADHQIVGYMYLQLYEKYGDTDMIAALKDRLDSIIDEPSEQPMDYKEGRHTQRWTWCDTLFMAPPVWARLSELTGDPKYRDWMFDEYKQVIGHLYDEEESLFYRDSRFFHEREQGAKIFWSRGNGWVFAGLPLIIESLDDGEQKDFFVTLYRKMAERIVELQNKTGLWPMSLLLEDVCTTPETSGSAFFVYGLAWGVNNGLLEGQRFRSAAIRGWNSLTSHVDADGMLGYVQPIGAAPGEAWPDRTEVYGVGAFLLAGTEMLELVDQD